jgi:alpha-L-rhamnosidase
VTPGNLRVEHLGDAVLGLGVDQPRLSWWADDGAAAHEIALGDGRTATVDAGRNVLVPWPFEPLASRERVSWQVRAEGGEWSAPAWFEVGLLAPDDWTARWIEPFEDERSSAHVLRHEFDLDAVGDARLHATAHGLYECFLNGRRVGDQELTPGFTSYDRILDVQAYDVADVLVEGTNVWEVVLTDGWFRGNTGIWHDVDGYGDTLAYLGQLEAGGTTVVTGAGWTSTTGPIRRADLLTGQVEDRRVEPGPWRPVSVVDHDLTRLAASPAPPVRRIEELRPASVRTVGPDRQVVDLGQNINGWVRLSDLGPAGTTVSLLHGEAVDGAGDVTTAHLGELLVQRDEVTSAGVDFDVFEPRHTTHGFQYVRVDGHPHRLTPDDVTGVVVHTDLRRTGWFRCSDERVNRFHELAEWSFRDNACDLPTDCPTRERSGWTGDWQIFVPSAAFLFDVAGFSWKWLRAVAAEQQPDGLLPNVVPDPRRPRAVAEGDLTWYGMLGSSGWGDACVLVPWELYRAYGDEQVLHELWPTMVGWLRYAANAARTRHHPSRDGSAPHEAFLWDGGWHWGEWCEPGQGQAPPFFEIDQGHVGSAFLHHTATVAARIGRLLGRDVDELDALAAGALDAWRTEYLADDGSLTPDTQANHVRALAFDLVPDELRRQTADRLVELIRAADDHLGTGFLATPYLLPVLADAGHLDVAYDLLRQDTPPSWLAMVERGATTVWENWEGLDEDGAGDGSLNHYSKGAVISFLHRYVAGIRLDEPAYRRFRVEPRPGGGMTWAEAVHDSPHGRIGSSWRIAGGTFTLAVTVPPGTTAEVRLPDGTVRELEPGTAELRCPA